MLSQSKYGSLTLQKYFTDFDTLYEILVRQKI